MGQEASTQQGNQGFNVKNLGWPVAHNATEVRVASDAPLWQSEDSDITIKFRSSSAS
jgi:hypothetical protein